MHRSTGFHGNTICIQGKCSPSPKSTPRVKVTLGIAAAPSSAAFGEFKVQHGHLPVPGSMTGRVVLTHPLLSLRSLRLELSGWGQGDLP